ncbi:hypothetical protein [Flexibacterium corallicola]|uniref:hypothetical protein n=1 Tax=Flexibacterium corallicola TaxID=3037259 RepID=UPI00286F8995|nr:hypothetical protein [Pseudovibrio sp. M1P-2-3]
MFSMQPDGKEEPRGHAYLWLGRNTSDLQSGKGAFILEKEKLAQQLANVSGSVIFSSEHFSWVFDEGELIQFHKALRTYFAQVKVIIYLRRQDRQLISHFQQSEKDRHSWGRSFYGTSTKAIPDFEPHFDNYLNYHQRLKIWSNVFGKKNIIPRVFEASQLQNSDVIDDFCQLLGIGRIEKLRMNEAIGQLEKHFYHLLEEAQFPHGHLRRTLIQNLQRSPQALPSKKQAIAIYERYRDSNRQLNTEFGISSLPALFKEDFSFYPEVSMNGWRADQADEAVRTLLVLLRQLDEDSFLNIRRNLRWKQSLTRRLSRIWAFHPKAKGTDLKKSR